MYVCKYVRTFSVAYYEHCMGIDSAGMRSFGMGWSLYTCSGFGVCVCRTEISDMKIQSSYYIHTCGRNISMLSTRPNQQ